MTPSTLVLKRLEDILDTHETSLARLTLNHSHDNNRDSGMLEKTQQNEGIDGNASTDNLMLPETKSKTTGSEGITTNTIVEAALRRSYCSQPPFDSSHLGGGSWNVVADLNLNPAERVAPHNLVLSSSSQQHLENDFGTTTHVSTNAGFTTALTDQPNMSILSRDDIESIVASSTLKAITAISTLCDEVQELEIVAHTKFIPKLTLFAHDLKIHTIGNSRNQSTGATATLAAVAATAIDDEVMAARDSELLRRIGSFLFTLQTIMNFSLRCQRLLRNLIAQMDGCFRPISSWGSSSGPVNTVIDDDRVESHDPDHRDASFSKENNNGQCGQTSNAANDPALFSRNHNRSQRAVSSCLPLPPVGDAIAKILGMLISIDYVIAHNLELQEAWDLYKSVVSDKSDQLQKLERQEIAQQHQHQQKQQQDTSPDFMTSLPITLNDDFANKDEPSNNNLLLLMEEKKKVMLLERMLLQIDFILISSRSYVIAIEQNFDPASRFFNATYYNGDNNNPNNDVSNYKSNTSLASAVGAGVEAQRSQSHVFTIHEEIKNLVMTMFRKCFSLIHTKHETTERKDMIGIYGMYGLYRRLLPSHLSPDETLHKLLAVDLPSICPILQLIGITDVPFLPLEFLSRYASLVVGNKSNGNNGGKNDNLKTIMDEARELVNKNDTTFFSSVQKLHADATLWVLAAESDLAPSTLSKLPSGKHEHLAEEVGDDDDDEDHPSSLPLGENDDDNDTLLTQKSMGGGKQQTPTSIVEFKTFFILRGIRIARCSIIMLKHYLNVHRSLDVPIRPDHIPSIEKLCSIIKSIEKTLRGRRRSSVVSYQQAALKMVASSIFKRFDTLRSYIDQHSASINRVQTLSEKIKLARLGASLSTLESLLKGSATFSPARRYAIEVAICACADGADDDNTDLKAMNLFDDLIYHLRLISDLDDNMKDAFDCSFLYFYKDILPTILQHLYESSLKLGSPRVQLVLSAFSDPCQLLSSENLDSQNEEKSPLLLEQYRSFVVDEALHSTLLIPICECIENNLRLHVYAKNIKELKPPNPKKEQSTDHVLWFLEIPLLHVCGVSVDIKGYVQRYLESSFYNFSTVGLQDSHSYVEMRVLAKDIYGLNLIDNCLPAGRVDQGIDLVVIAKDIKLFTSTYNYNMNQQNFIERASKDGCKHLNTIGIETVSFSLKRHGMGIAARISHVAYQFISETFQSFSKLLVNDYFRSILSKERRWFDQQKNAQDVPYPIDRAITLSKDIANLGTMEGICTLEYCTNLVTLLGNALGLARLVQAGKLNATNDVMQYLTPIRSCFSNNDRSSNTPNTVKKSPEYIYEETIKSTNDMDQVERMKSILHSKSSKENDFLQVVIKVFKDVILDSDHPHMDCVFLLFPALCLCWLESSLKGKSMVNKSFRTDDAFYTDDGFAMGATFLLSILDQHEKLDRLSWFETFRAKYIIEQNDLLVRITEEKSTLKSMESNKHKSLSFLSFESQQNSKPAEENKAAINSELTRLKVIAKRLELRRQEMEMLYFSMHGARIFFKAM